MLLVVTDSTARRICIQCTQPIKTSSISRSQTLNMWWSPFSLQAATLAILISGAYTSPARRKWGLLDERELPSHPTKEGLPAYNTTYWFDQLIDHNNPSLGTFKQRFFFSAEFYEPGGPIILENAGEGNADDSWRAFLPDLDMQGKIAQSVSGASIQMEHRFFGKSNPYPDLSEESLQYLTVQQNIDDMVYLAQNLVLPMEGGDSVGPDRAPWILIGGSYAGAVVNWAVYQHPEIFYAGYASSAVVQAIENFWQYFEPERINMPANCSSDIQAVITHIDEVFDSGNEAAINDVKMNPDGPT
ncbi:hypothetical protein BDZ89DRAFT_1159835 [Hymenopellis radicata]|nr:hypothetical protein BDZ89DRAFT_1159835 [Hymenopellis radicata]